MDWELAVLILFLATTVLGFIWRRTSSKLWLWIWLAAMQVEIWARKMRDRTSGRRDV